MALSYICNIIEICRFYQYYLSNRNDETERKMTNFRILRKQLDDLGYYQPLVIDSVPLVEALLHDLLATTNSLKLCKDSKEPKQQYNHDTTNSNELRNISKPSASSTPIVSYTPEETNTKIIRLQSRMKDLEDLNQECNSIIRRQQIELDEKSKKILKLELNSGIPKAKVITHNDRPLIISDTLKPRIEMTSLIGQKEISNSKSTRHEKIVNDEPQSQIDLIKLYEKRNQHLDRELARLQVELDKARKLLAQAEKHWNWNTNGQPVAASSAQSNSNEMHLTSQGPKSNYMTKVINVLHANYFKHSQLKLPG